MLEEKILMWKTTRKTPAKPDADDCGNTELARSLYMEVTILLKYLLICGSHDLHLINCKVVLDLSWRKACLFVLHYNNLAGVNFTIASTKLYVPVVTLSMNENIEFLKHLKKGFKRKIF